MSSADGWLVEGESPKAGARVYAAKKRRPKTGEGRAYTQNPTTAQARDPARASQLFRRGGRVRRSEGEPDHARQPNEALSARGGRGPHERQGRRGRRLTRLGPSCSGVLA